MSYPHAGQWGSETFIDPAGRPLGHTLVTVYLRGTLTKADLFVDRIRTASQPNPFLTDFLGNGFFYADPGLYDVSCNGAAVPVVVEVDAADEANEDAVVVNNLVGTSVHLDASAARAFDLTLTSVAVSIRVDNVPAGHVKLTLLLRQGAGGNHTVADWPDEDTLLALDWVNSRFYLTGDRVTFDDDQWEATANNDHEPPSDVSAFWERVSAITYWAGGAAPTLSTAAAARDMVTLETLDGGAHWYGTHVFGHTEEVVEDTVVTINGGGAHVLDVSKARDFIVNAGHGTVLTVSNIVTQHVRLGLRVNGSGVNSADVTYPPFTQWPYPAGQPADPVGNQYVTLETFDAGASWVGTGVVVT